MSLRYPEIRFVHLRRTALSSAALSASVASAICGDRDLCKTRLALYMLLLADALRFALPEALLLRSGHGSLVRWAAFEDLDCFLQGLRLRCAALFAVLEILRDEVTPGLDFFQVSLSRNFASGLLLKLRLLLLQLSPFLSERRVELRKSLHEIRLFLFKVSHRVLVGVLGLLLVLVGHRFLLLRLVQDEFEHLDDLCAFLALPSKAPGNALFVLPRRWRRWVLLSERG